MINNANISFKHQIIKSGDIIVSDMDGEKVMLSVQNGKYYNLGKVGGRIWELMDRPVSVAQLVTALMSEYEVEQAECEEQVLSFLEHLRKEGLVQYK
jgi:hypothetical protein